jgi:hypothetical protein
MGGAENGNVEEAGQGRGGERGMGRWGGLSQEERTASILKSPLFSEFYIVNVLGH